MTFLDQSHRQPPTGVAKMLHLNWAIILLLCAIASTGFLMLYSVANGSFDPWASRQMVRFSLGWQTTRQEITETLAAVKSAVAALRG